MSVPLASRQNVGYRMMRCGDCPLVFIFHIKVAGLETTFVAVNNNALPGIPPSSLMTFLQARSDIPGVVITDYETQYSNK